MIDKGGHFSVRIAHACQLHSFYFLFLFITKVQKGTYYVQRTIVITGGAGFIGINLMQHALVKGYDVVLVDVGDRLHRLEQTGIHPHAHLRFLEQNLAASNFSFKEDIHALIHLAALAQVDYSLYYPSHVFINNTCALANLLDFARDRSVPLLLTSSVEIYGGNDDSKLFLETDSQQALSPYAASKIGCEALLHSYVACFGIQASIVRLTNLYGPWQAPDRIIPRLITQALSQYNSEVDWGRVRDYLYVEDAVKALLGIVEKSLWGETFNIASEQGYDNSEIASILKKVSNNTANIVVSDTRQKDGRGKALLSSHQKLQTALEWKPSVSLEEGMRLAFNWYAEHQDWWRQFDENIKLNRQNRQFLTDYTHNF